MKFEPHSYTNRKELSIPFGKSLFETNEDLLKNGKPISELNEFCKTVERLNKFQKDINYAFHHTESERIYKKSMKEEIRKANLSFNNEITLKISTENIKHQPTQLEKNTRRKVGLTYFMSTGNKIFK
jgi:predicted restriction endonuclease